MCLGTWFPVPALCGGLLVSHLEAEIEDEDESEADLLSLPLSPVTQLSILG